MPSFNLITTICVLLVRSGGGSINSHTDVVATIHGVPVDIYGASDAGLFRTGERKSVTLKCIDPEEEIKRLLSVRIGREGGGEGKEGGEARGGDIPYAPVALAQERRKARCFGEEEDSVSPMGYT